MLSSRIVLRPYIIVFLVAAGLGLGSAFAFWCHTEPEPVRAPVKTAVNTLLENEQWEAAYEKCTDFEGDCESFHLEFVRRAMKSDDFEGARSAIEWLSDKGAPFGSEPGSVSFRPSEAEEVLRLCSVGRKLSYRVCRGLEDTIAAGLLATGKDHSLAEAYERLDREGLVAESRHDGEFADLAREQARRDEFGKAIRTCEHGLGHGEKECAELIADFRTGYLMQRDRERRQWNQ
jgi:hypothetical protein